MIKINTMAVPATCQVGDASSQAGERRKGVSPPKGREKLSTPIVRASVSGLMATVCLMGTAVSGHAAADTAGYSDRAFMQRVLNSSNPEGAYAALSDKDKGRYASLSVVVSEEVTVGERRSAPAVAAADACYDSTVHGKGKSVAGVTLYTYDTSMRWCVTNGRNTSARLTQIQGDAKIPGWKYEGIRQKWAGISTGKAVGYAQYHFRLDPPGPIPGQDRYPCTRIIGNGSSVRHDARCSQSV